VRCGTQVRNPEVSHNELWGIIACVWLAVGPLVPLCGRAIEELRHLTSFSVAWAGRQVKTHVWCGVVEGLPVYLIEPEQPAAFFWRGRFYGEVWLLEYPSWIPKFSVACMLQPRPPYL